METFYLEKDVSTFYVAATSFPAGIQTAWEQLHTLLNGQQPGRATYGISFQGEDGQIVYWAAAGELEAGEGTQYGCPTFTIPAGHYACERMVQFRQHLHLIEPVFKRLLAVPERAYHAFCLEWYQNCQDLLCMVLLRNKTAANTL